MECRIVRLCIFVAATISILTGVFNLEAGTHIRLKLSVDRSHDELKNKSAAEKASFKLASTKIPGEDSQQMKNGARGRSISCPTCPTQCPNWPNCFPNSGEKCCREKGVPDVCFGYCETERTDQQRQGLKTGICEKWFEQIGKCRTDYLSTPHETSNPITIPPTTEGCTKDDDCKGDRICVERQCTGPEPRSCPCCSFKTISCRAKCHCLSEEEYCEKRPEPMAYELCLPQPAPTTPADTTTTTPVTTKACQTIDIDELQGGLDCQLPFNDCRREIKIENNWKCVTRAKCHPHKFLNGTIKYYWCSTGGDFHGDWDNYGVCEESCPK